MGFFNISANLYAPNNGLKITPSSSHKALKIRQKGGNTVEKTIENMMTEILCNYGNTAYLKKSSTKSLDNVRGTTLWKLWYGDSDTDFCLALMDQEYAKAKADDSLMPAFEENVENLLTSLQREFNKITI